MGGIVEEIYRRKFFGFLENEPVRLDPVFEEKQFFPINDRVDMLLVIVQLMHSRLPIGNLIDNLIIGFTAVEPRNGANIRYNLIVSKSEASLSILNHIKALPVKIVVSKC
jgi:hypothetical protein